MNARAAGDRASVRDWVDTSFDSAPTSDYHPFTGAAKEVRHERRGSLQESAFDLKQGCDVAELDTIPAELLDLFK